MTAARLLRDLLHRSTSSGTFFPIDYKVGFVWLTSHRLTALYTLCLKQQISRYSYSILFFLITIIQLENTFKYLDICEPHQNKHTKYSLLKCFQLKYKNHSSCFEFLEVNRLEYTVNLTFSV